MSKLAKTVKLCSCNGSIPLDGEALARGLGMQSPLPTHRTLCRRELAAFTQSLEDPAVLVCCTQETALFREVAEQNEGRGRVDFVNIRETAGWSREGRAATPKIAALIAAALHDGEGAPPETVSYRSEGSLVIIGPTAPAIDWAERLQETFEVTVLISDRDGGELPMARRYPVHSGQPTGLRGHLGAFELSWTAVNPIDLDLCTRCGQCVRACPEGAIGFDFQIDLDRCRSHRACVAACGDIGAIDFDRVSSARTAQFDMVLDLGREPLLRMVRCPSGYAAPGRDPLDQAESARRLAGWIGEFEKPRYVHFERRLCAHGRSGKTGCTRCLDTCSTGAIAPAGNEVRVDPWLCMGCGGCAAVCPSGAMAHTAPGVPDITDRVRRMLDAYRAAGGGSPVLLCHDPGEGAALIGELARHGRGLPADVLPLECHHVAAIGIDVMLAALAYGAARFHVMMTGDDAGEYGDATAHQMAIAQAIAGGLGRAAECLSLLRPHDWRDLDAALERARATAPAPSGHPPRMVPAQFAGSADKRTTLRLAIDHMVRQMDAPPAAVALPPGAPFGGLIIDKGACTLCKACIGACPSSALIDYQDAPRLQFIEANCVQCGLCVNTCPEDAIALQPRLLLDESARQPVLLNEDEAASCVRCGNPFGTRRMIDRMAERIGAHPMFAGSGGARRLQMCADCRVLDMIENKNEMSIMEVPRPPKPRDFSEP